MLRWEGDTLTRSMAAEPVVEPTRRTRILSPGGTLTPGPNAICPESQMNDVTGILSAIERGDPQAADLLLPLVYDELRKLAAQKLVGEKPGQTLQGTALVHD